MGSVSWSNGLLISQAPIWDLLSRYDCCYPRIRALLHSSSGRVQSFVNPVNTLIGGRPLLITPGQCARFVDEELEDLTGVWPLGYCQIHFFVCIYLCGQFLKARKAAYENYRKEH